MKDLLKFSKLEGLARRYFIMNSFDGALTILGIIIGSLIGGNRNSNLIITTALGTAFAMGISGFWGVYISERAERLKELKKMEKKLLKKLDKSYYKKSINIASIILSLIDALSPVIPCVLGVIPFLVLKDFVLSVYISISIIIFYTFILGFYLGVISKENPFIYGFKTLAASLIIFTILFYFVRM